MSDFKTGGVPAPDYDSDDINYVYKKSEFTEDIFVYGDVYGQSFNNVEMSVVGSTLTFTVAGIGSTSLILSWVVDKYYTYAIIRIMYYQDMDDFVFEVVVDICARTFKLKSDNGNDKIIACDNTDEFMRVLDVCDKMLEPRMIVYADLALTSDK